MIRRASLCLLILVPILSYAAERVFDFTRTPAGAAPEGWTNMLAGAGKLGAWEVRMEDAPSAFLSNSPQAPKINKIAVLAQVSVSSEDERFPIMIWTGERYGDFTFTSRFKITAGSLEQIAGFVFRFQDPRNFYVVRASALGNNLRFYKFVDGVRSAPIGPLLPFEKGRWYEISVRASGNQLDILLDGAKVIPTLTDNSFVSGRLGFMTKSDSEAVFADARVTYRPLESLAAALVRQTLEDQPRLSGIRLFGVGADKSGLKCLAAKNPIDVGEPGGETQRKVFAENQVYFSQTSKAAVVTAPLHDRNGEVIGVMEFRLKPFPGQTESTTVARIIPSLRKLEASIGGADDLFN